MTKACEQCGLLHPAGHPCFALALSPSLQQNALQPGTILAGRYRIQRMLQRGGMSAVYLALDSKLVQEVALKEVRLPTDLPLAEQREVQGWFARESFLLSILRHPLIPSFYTRFDENGHSYIVQEYVEGQNLHELVARQGPVDQHTVVTWGRALCEFLTYLHGLPAPVVFRDLKPANILVRSGTEQLAVVDFGIARPFLPGEVGTVIGTPGYAPPEQYQGLATPQSDIYALGATLYSLLTGYDPEQGTPFSFAPIRQLNPSVSQVLAAEVERAVRLKADERYRTAAEFGRALLGATAWLPYKGHPQPIRTQTLATPLAAPTPHIAPTPPPSATPRRRWAWMRGLLGAVILLPSLVLIGFGVMRMATTTSVSQHLSSAPVPQQPTIVPPGQLKTQVTKLATIVPWGNLSCKLGAPTVSASYPYLLSVPDGVLITTRNRDTPFDRITPAGEVAPCTLSEPLHSIDGMVASTPGSYWIASDYRSYYDPTFYRASQNGEITKYELPSQMFSYITNEVGGPDGSIWFTAGGLRGALLMQLTIAGQLRTTFLPDTLFGSSISLLAVDKDGTAYLNASSQKESLGLDPSGGVKRSAIPNGATCVTNALWNIWCVGADTTTLVRLGANQQIATSTFAIGNPLAADDSGNLWFTMGPTDQSAIARLTPHGQLSQFPLPLGMQPTNCAIGPDGALWVSATQRGSSATIIVRVSSAGKITTLATIS